MSTSPRRSPHELSEPAARPMPPPSRRTLDAFAAGIADLEAALAEIDAAHAGAEVFVTEPVPLYLVDGRGPGERRRPTPSARPSRKGRMSRPRPSSTSLKLLRSGDVSVVIVNAQTGGAETTEVISEAEAQAIPVVEFSETLPDGQTYLSWMQANIEALAGALERVTTTAPLEIRGAALRRGDRELWSGLDLDRRARRADRGARAERLGQDHAAARDPRARARSAPGASARSAKRCAVAATAGSATSRSSGRCPRDTALRGRDLVALGVDGHRFGLPLPAARRPRPSRPPHRRRRCARVRRPPGGAALRRRAAAAARRAGARRRSAAAAVRRAAHEPRPREPAGGRRTHRPAPQRHRRRRAAGDARHQPAARQGRPHPLHRERPVHAGHARRGAALATCSPTCTARTCSCCARATGSSWSARRTPRSRTTTTRRATSELARHLGRDVRRARRLRRDPRPGRRTRSSRARCSGSSAAWSASS